MFSCHEIVFWGPFNAKYSYKWWLGLVAESGELAGLIEQIIIKKARNPSFLSSYLLTLFTSSHS